MTCFNSRKLVNADRNFTIEAEACETGEVRGRLYHRRMDGGVEFQSLLQAVEHMNQTLDETGHLTVNMQSRRFRGSYGQAAGTMCQRNAEYEQNEFSSRRTVFEIIIDYRFGTSWQGRITCKEKGTTVEFKGFIKMLSYMGDVLGVKKEEKLQSFGPGVCEIVVSNSRERELAGYLYHMENGQAMPFRSIVELAMQMEELYLGIPKHPAIICRPQIIENQWLGIHKEKNCKAAFGIRIIFCQNDTLQGVVRWREKREYTNFRSFMELIFLIEEAVNCGEHWSTDSESEKISSFPIMR